MKIIKINKILKNNNKIELKIVNMDYTRGVMIHINLICT